MKIVMEQLETMCRLAEEAGAAIMAIYSDEFSVAFKKNNSPLTIADLKADQIIRNGLEAEFPGVFILSEESTSTVSEGNDPDLFFLVDPLDGTKEFVSKSGEFTVNIALIYDGHPIAGVVYAPALDILYFAGKNLGAWRRMSVIEPIRASARDHNAPLRVIGSRSHGSEEMAIWLAAQNCEYSLVTAGSSLKFCKVAEGLADVYPRLAPTSQWDTAAAQIIVEAAGGSVLTIDGIPLMYGLTCPIVNQSFIASGRTG